MDGSALVFILLPIVSISLIAGWIGMLFYVDAHPGQTQSAATEVTAADSAADPWSAPRPGLPAEPARRTGAVPIPLPRPAYSRPSPEPAGVGRAAPLTGDAQRPAA